MKNERKIQVLAEADGCKQSNACPHCCDGYTGDEQNHYPCGYCNATGKVSMHFIEVPDYLNRRDAIVPAIVKWCGEDNGRWEKFFVICGLMYHPPSHTYWFETMKNLFKASAEQLSNALIRAMGKWEESS